MSNVLGFLLHLPRGWLTSRLGVPSNNNSAIKTQMDKQE